jgi:FkbM family methyltransferase
MTSELAAAPLSAAAAALPQKREVAARSRLAHALTPAARAWLRYAPWSTGKDWLWQKFHWRARDFSCRMRSGARMTGNTRDLIQRHLYFFGAWEPNITQWIADTLQPGDVFIDIGANIGYYSLLASTLVGDQGKVVAIEAAPWIHARLDDHVAMNGRANIRTVQVAASSAAGTLQLFPGNADNIGKTTTVGGNGDAIEVPALPMADILRDDEIRRARIIKIDVEGAEPDVLRGLEPVLRRMRDDLEIVMEVSPALMPGAERSRDEIFATLLGLGFRPYAFENDYGVETYLRRGRCAPPVALTDLAFSAQTDVLFSRCRA